MPKNTYQGTDKFNLGTGLGLGVAMPLFHCSHNFYHMDPFPFASLSLAYRIGAWELGTVIYCSLTLKIYVVPLVKGLLDIHTTSWLISNVILSCHGLVKSQVT